MQEIIEFRNIKKAFKGNEILKDVSFSIKENQIFGLVGKSGAGKTTLIRILLGIYTPDSGKTMFKGKSIKRLKFSIRKKIGFATQENSFFPRLTAEENLFYYGRMYGVKSKKLKARVDELLSLMQLTYARKTLAKNLSGGMKRRLDLAISIVHDPDVLILDEPTTGLDIVLQRSIWNHIKEIHAMGKTLIISSHMLHSLQEHCTSFGLLHAGYFYDKKNIAQYMKKYHTNNLEELFVKLFMKND